MVGNLQDDSAIQIDPQTEVKQVKGCDMEKLSSEDDDDKPFEKFSLMDSPLDKSFCSNFRAVMLKRFQTYKRNKSRVFCEVILPSVFMIFGVWLASVNWSFRSDSRLFTPSLYPMKQKLLVNE